MGLVKTFISIFTTMLLYFSVWFFVGLSAIAFSLILLALVKIKIKIKKKLRGDK